jgi:hypothetical protein
LTIALICGKIAMAENLVPRLDGDYVRVNAPQTHFLIGRALERLHNGAVVTYLLQLSVRTERFGRASARIAERFTVSYDLWEEKFAVTRQSVPARSASNLSAAAAESWCLENVLLPVAKLPSDKTFWITLEFGEAPKDSGRSDPVSLTLSSLIDIFSRKPHDEQEVRGAEEAGPLRLEDLRKKK